jgi:hypothetical protein
MKTKSKPIKKASNDPVKEAMGHPSGPSLTEMICGEEDKTPKKKIQENDEPDCGPIPVI